MRRIRGWVGAGEARGDDLDRQLDEVIRLLLLMQSAQHQWWKSRLTVVLGYGLRDPEDARRRIEERLFAFGGRPGKRSYLRKAGREKTIGTYREALDQLMAEAVSASRAGGASAPSMEAVEQLMTEKP